ncbi:alpha/beta hydrolase [Marinibactrum halimedae]|uniref:Alpha/beta hydrolase n=2 Tax=Marinibactrum halimedae TaxID=1444977 RepID=A0AA37T0L6_9GAMM|nr:alpha/beta hydrolase [Marinibactrum halimedae]
MTFTPQNGESVEALKGVIQVPENRQRRGSPMIPLHYVRFPATTKNPGSPIVYLAGGPGGSGINTAKGRRFPLFMQLRKYGDVIALDQRGTGLSDVTPACRSKQPLPSDQIMDDKDYIERHQKALKECVRFWGEQKVDLKGYNTLESVADLEALRKHLNAEKITLWGISYGSHLALAAIKKMDDRIDKVIIASVEGLQQTIKLPQRTDAYFKRLQTAIHNEPLAKQQYPDIFQLIQRVHQRLEMSPLTLTLSPKDKPPFEFILQRRTMQQFASRMISDPIWTKRLLQLYLAVDQGDVPLLQQQMARYLAPSRPIQLRAMPTAMDIASGMSQQRRTKIEEQAKTALLGSYLNFSFHYTDVLPELDLGDEFRQPPQSSIPVLLLSGTLDGRTYIESQREAVTGLKNITAVTVVNAGHNLFMSSPEVGNIMEKFLKGQSIIKKSIIVQLPDFGNKT